MRVGSQLRDALESASRSVGGRLGNSLTLEGWGYDLSEEVEELEKLYELLQRAIEGKSLSWDDGLVVLEWAYGFSKPRH